MISETTEKESLATAIETEKDQTEIKTDQDFNKAESYDILTTVDDRNVMEKTEDVLHGEEAKAGSSEELPGEESNTAKNVDHPEKIESAISSIRLAINLFSTNIYLMNANIKKTQIFNEMKWDLRVN